MEFNLKTIKFEYDHKTSNEFFSKKLFNKIPDGNVEVFYYRRDMKHFSMYRAVPGLNQRDTAAIMEGLTYNFFLNLYMNGANVDALLNDLTPQESNRLLNDLYDAAHNGVMKDLTIIGTDIQQIVQDNKYNLYEEFKTSISRYGLESEENPDFTKEERATDTLGIRDSITINPKKMTSLKLLLALLSDPYYNQTSVNVKLLLASLPDSHYNKEGKMIVNTYPSLNQPKLVSYDRVHTILLNELSNLVTKYDVNGNQVPLFETMIQRLEEKYRNPRGFYKEGFTWIRNLKLRLKYEDINGSRIPQEALSLDDVMLQVGFIKSFANARIVPQKTIFSGKGRIYNFDPVNKVKADRVNEKWSNNIKTSFLNGTSNLLELSSDGIMTINGDSQDYRDLIGALNAPRSFDLDKSLDVLSKLGITFSATKPELDRYKVSLREHAMQILSLIKSGEINTITDLYGGRVIGGRINDLLSIEARFTAEENILSYLNADGESQYAVGLPSLMSNVINSLNSVSSLKELVRTFPWLGNVNAAGEAALFGYQLNSELLRPGGVLFDRKGNRYVGRNIEFQVISGIGDSNYVGTNTANLEFPDRIANKIRYLLNNTVFSNINSDKNTEYGIKLPGQPLVDVTDIRNLLFYEDRPSEITDLYIRHLTDEMYTAMYNSRNPSTVQYYKDKVESLSHFKDILGSTLITRFQKEVLSKRPRYKGSNAHEQFILANNHEIRTAINEYLVNKIDETVQFLLDSDIFTRLPEYQDLYITDAIDNDLLTNVLRIESNLVEVAVIDGESQRRNGFNENNLRILAGFLAFNEEILITEQHKIIYGHPAFYNDLPKRANGATSTKETMVDDVKIIQWMDNNMQRNDLKERSREQHQTINVISFKDQNVISEIYKNIVKDMFKDMSKTESKDEAEKKIGARSDKNGDVESFIIDKKSGEFTGFLKAYLNLNEADAMAWGMPDAIRDMLFLTGKLTKQQQAQWDYEIAYEKVKLNKKDPDRYNYGTQELNIAREIVAAGDPGYVFQVLKPQYFGYAANPNMMHPVFLKHAVQPKFYRHVEGTQYESLYLASKNSQVDIIGFESGEKVGNIMTPQGDFVPLYNDQGSVNVIEQDDQFNLPDNLPQQHLYARFYGIQRDIIGKAGSSM